MQTLFPWLLCCFLFANSAASAQHTYNICICVYILLFLLLSVLLAMLPLLTLMPSGTTGTTPLRADIPKTIWERLIYKCTESQNKDKNFRFFFSGIGLVNFLLSYYIFFFSFSSFSSRIRYCCPFFDNSLCSVWPVRPRRWSIYGDTGFLYAANCLGGNGRIYCLEPRAAIEKYATVCIPGRLVCMGRTKLARNGSAGRATFFLVSFLAYFLDFCGHKTEPATHNRRPTKTGRHRERRE